MSRIRPVLPALALTACAALLAGCPAKQPVTQTQVPQGQATASGPSSASLTATAEAGKAEADRDAAVRAAAAAAIAEAEKEIAAAKEAKAPLFAYDLYQQAVELLQAAQTEFAKPAFATAKDRAVESAAKAREAKAKALAAKSGPRLTVQKGHTLWGIARIQLADAFLWPLLYQANLDLIQDPNKIFPSQEFVIPKASSPDDRAKAQATAAAAPAPR